MIRRFKRWLRLRKLRNTRGPSNIDWTNPEELDWLLRALRREELLWRDLDPSGVTIRIKFAIEAIEQLRSKS